MHEITHRKLFFFNFQINFHTSKNLGGAPCPPVDPLRNDCLGLHHDSLDMGQIMANTPNSEKPNHSRSERNRTKTSTKFYLQFHNTLMILDIQICLKTFLFLHGTGRYCYDAVHHHYLENGIEDWIHGNSNRIPFNRFTTS